MRRSLLCLGCFVGRAVACTDLDVGLGSSSTWEAWGDVPLCDDVYMTKVIQRDANGDVSGYDHSLGARWCQEISSFTIEQYNTASFGSLAASDWTYSDLISGSDSLIETWCGRTCAQVGVASSGLTDAARKTCGYCLDMDVGLGESPLWTSWGDLWGDADNCSQLESLSWCQQNAGLNIASGSNSYKTLTFGTTGDWDPPPNTEVTSNFVDTFCGSSCGKYNIKNTDGSAVGCSKAIDLEIGLTSSTTWTGGKPCVSGYRLADISPYSHPCKNVGMCADYLWTYKSASRVASSGGASYNVTGLDPVAAKAWCENNRLTTLDQFKATWNLAADWTYPSYVSGSDFLIDTWCGYTCSRFGVIRNPPALPPSPSPLPPPASNSTSSDKKKGFPVGGIVGVVIGGIVLVVALSFLVWILVKKKPVNPDSEATHSRTKPT